MRQAMRFQVRDPDDLLAPGVTLKEYDQILPVPREYEIVRVNNQKYQVVEQGVLYNYVHDGVFITVVLEKVPE